MDDASLYSADPVAWSERQADALRRLAARAPSNAVDWTNVIEEIECVGRSERKAVESLIAHALAPVVTGVADPAGSSFAAWRREVAAALGDARDDHRPSMNGHIDMDTAWPKGVRHAGPALAERGVSIPPGLPATCPFTLEDIVRETFTFDTAVARLRRETDPTPETRIS